MTGEEIETSIELAKLVGFQCYKTEDGYLIRNPKGESEDHCFPQGNEIEAWEEAFKYDSTLLAYATDLDALFALARERKLGMRVELYQDGLAYAYVWKDKPDIMDGAFEQPTEALAACRALIEALKALK